MEEELGIEGSRWTPTRAEWKEAKQLSARDNYRKAAGQLEFLVISRFFELDKLNCIGVCRSHRKFILFMRLMNFEHSGYKQRRHVVKAVQSRNKAIQTAVERYNETARKLPIPRRALTVEEALQMTTVGDFDLLRLPDAGPNEAPLAWTDPLNRAAAISFFKAKRAREELVRVDVEARRILAYMRDLEIAMHAAIERTRPDNSLLAFQLQRHLQYVVARHALQRTRLSRFCTVSHADGQARPGVALQTSSSSADMTGNAVTDEDEQVHDDDNDDSDDEGIDPENLITMYSVLDDHVL